MKNPKNIVQLLKQNNVSLILGDLGASGENWEVFELLKPIANLLRFDPDERDMREVLGTNGRRVITINRAVVEHDLDKVDFYLTNSPYCSSTLKPDFKRVKNYPYADLFEVKDIRQVSAITLNQAIISSDLSHIDWIKIDTQGTELRILNSISDDIFDRLLVCDIEASLYSHYIDADTLPSMHELMLEKDFWIVEMRPHWNTRISANRLKELEQRYKGKTQNIFQYSKHKEITTLELCYVRTLEGAKKQNYEFEQFICLFLCHFILEAFEYCLEILSEIENLFGNNEILDLLRQETFNSIDERTQRAQIPYYVDALIFRLKRMLPSLWQN